MHATLLEMNLRVYELFVAPLRVEDKDRYCVESSSIEGLFGIPEGHLPRSISELQRYMRLWLPLEYSARGHASTAGGIGPHVFALDASE